MDKYLFDACSLISLVRYYLPFDSDNKLKDFICKGFEYKEFLMLKEVKDECDKVAGGLIFKELPQLKNIKSTNFNEIITDKIHKLIDNNFIVFKTQIDKLGEFKNIEYEAQRQKFIESADFKLIHCAMTNKDKYIIVTEETPTNNDNKLFKKIPTICKMQNIKCISLVELLKERVDICFVKKHNQNLSLFDFND